MKCWYLISSSHCIQCQVTASHIVVNQLIDDYLTSNEMEKVARILKTCGRGGYEGDIEFVSIFFQ